MASMVSGNGSVRIGDGGRILSLSLGGKRVEIDYSVLMLNDEQLEAEWITGGPETFALSSPTQSAALYIEGDNGSLSIGMECEGESQRFGLQLPVNLDCKIHLPERLNVVRLLDREMPVGESYSTRVGPNFCIVEYPSLSVLLLVDECSEHQRKNQATRTIARHPEMMTLSVETAIKNRITMSVHESPKAALDAFTAWIADGLGFLPRSRRPNRLEWVEKVRHFVFIDMLRSTGEVVNSYHDLELLSAELAEAGCPKETVFYIPGWNGPYDAAYPDYAPRDELGGDAAFARMVDALHRDGFRVMIHTNPWGLDPYHPEIEGLLKYAVKDQFGAYAGFQTPSRTKWGQAAPESRLIAFASGRQPIKLEGAGTERSFATVSVPDQCEALVTVGGFKRFDGRVTVRKDERWVSSPVGWFADHDEHTFQFAFRLDPGVNRLQIEAPAAAIEGAEPWYRIHNCRVPPTPYATWTYPILFGDTTNKEWNRLVIENIAATVEKYDIDAIHCDATEYEPNKLYYEMLKARLPKTAIGAEGFSSLSGMGFFDFTQSHENLSLTEYASTYAGTVFQGSLPDWSALGASLAWLDKASPLMGFVDAFVRPYPHLCAVDSFVPVGKVCTCSDEVKSPRESDRLRKILADAPRLKYIPAIRINYGEFGLDKESIDYFRSLAQ